MSKQTQDTMLMVGALAGVVGFVAFVALMVVGGAAFSPALFIAILLAAVVAMVLLLGFHSKPHLKNSVSQRAQTAGQALKSAVAPSEPQAPVATEAAPVVPAPVAAQPLVAPDVGAAVTVPDAKRPEALSAPRHGKADDLKQIKGIGPKLEELCHTLGFFHFDQIAGWTDAEIAWVDENLEGFKGRVSRDEWVAQAKILAAGGTTEFSQRNGGT